MTSVKKSVKSSSAEARIAGTINWNKLKSNVAFWGVRKKPEYPGGKTSKNRVENQQTQPTHESGNWTQGHIGGRRVLSPPRHHFSIASRVFQPSHCRAHSTNRTLCAQESNIVFWPCDSRRSIVRAFDQRYRGHRFDFSVELWNLSSRSFTHCQATIVTVIFKCSFWGRLYALIVLLPYGSTPEKPTGIQGIVLVFLFSPQGMGVV